MLYFAFSAPLTFILALLAGVGAWGSPLVLAHGVFAVGIVPLIFAAMSHFVPVLTRSGAPHKAIGAIPAIAQGAGFLAVLAMGGWLPRGYLHLAALVAFFLALTLLVWMVQRSRRCLGPAHPGWRWYGAALVMFALAMVGVPLLDHWPAAYAALRRFHLHLNTLGLVGLAALGTLPLLLATALKQPNPAVGLWLRQWLLPVVSGVSLTALGAAWWSPLAGFGALLIGSGLLVLLAQSYGQYGLKVLLAPGAAPSLLVAVLGLLLTIIFGVAHGIRILVPTPAILAWGLAFLLPLVTGALSYLLPVWRYPGPASPARERLAQRLCWASRARAACFLLGGLAAHLDWMPGAVFCAGLGLGLFVLALTRRTLAGA